MEAYNQRLLYLEAQTKSLEQDVKKTSELLDKKLENVLESNEGTRYILIERFELLKQEVKIKIDEMPSFLLITIKKELTDIHSPIVTKNQFIELKAEMNSTLTELDKNKEEKIGQVESKIDQLAGKIEGKIGNLEGKLTVQWASIIGTIIVAAITLATTIIDLNNKNFSPLTPKKTMPSSLSQKTTP